ncbi:MAG: hypothetical protein JWS10_2868 [Cypionkella sp.]|nr:hypothetical protein [Cypionkella sp.]
MQRAVFQRGQIGNGCCYCARNESELCVAEFIGSLLMKRTALSKKSCSASPCSIIWQRLTGTMRNAPCGGRRGQIYHETNPVRQYGAFQNLSGRW